MSVDCKVNLWQEPDAKIQCRWEPLIGGLVLNLGDDIVVFLSPLQAHALAAIIAKELQPDNAEDATAFANLLDRYAHANFHYGRCVEGRWRDKADEWGAKAEELKGKLLAAMKIAT